MLATTHTLQAMVRRRLHTEFATSLARFDYLAQLERAQHGLRMREISERLMVTGGNVTGLTDSLERDGLVRREPDPDDRRASRVRLTAAGRSQFAAMARQHEKWIVEVLGVLGRQDVAQLKSLLGRVKESAQTRLQR
ncbi:MAG: MarR family transcriptional regulator [Gammaproteobacteria bacterium]|nr:MarR family transcriptional regulator [Gammaproteobacteria bacterium]